MANTETEAHARGAADVPVKTATRRGAVAVVGLGYVGLPLALAAEGAGYAVSGFDIDPVKIEFLKKREANYLRQDELAAFSKSAMRVSLDERVLAGADIIVVCVPTPVLEDRTPDLAPLRDAAFVVGRNLKEGALVVVESTVSPGACETVVVPVIERVSGRARGEGFLFAHCPERMNPGDERYAVGNIPRVVGANDARSLKAALAFYRSVVAADILPMTSVKEAEAVKMVENAFRDVNIAFVNELAMSFERSGIDITHVLSAAATKPFSFLAHAPGCGVGGHCIPVDPYYLIHYGKENGFSHRFLKVARDVNNGMPRHAVRRLEEALAERGTALSGTTVALLGLTYKSNVPDLRESPALAIRDELVARGALVRSFDPYAVGESSVRSVEAALSGADGAIIATDHREFCALSPSAFLRLGVTVVVDGRNCLPKERFLAEGISYRGIGR